MMKPTIEKLKEIIQPLITDYGAELVDLELKGKTNKWLLRIFVDIDGGITVDDCARITRNLMSLPELDLVLGNNYRLEVSSPGVDRPLTTRRDFERNRKKEVRIDYRVADRLVHIEGEIFAVNDRFVTVKDAAQVENQIPLDSIVQAKIKLKW